ncbi:nucleotide sugar dehydrogenase [Mesorhizobium sp. BAC0120]|uniref:nucleotide sugar dehydrogenase n=1 Tax=Mesorhizobium sp. BAC0120 TaxID=3090670 RepID=UPI00298C260C|nr:nucleotide sugar dehydrogenase [Mesorhizobium sp. BAC0120]MDW6021572.1 nucleotide sugar dehydrogenase [Mesorhizobium sp. BAC0120]
MRIAVFGLGYVGFTTLCCLAHEGHEALGFELNRSKVEAINSGVAPIIEPGLSEMLRCGLAAGRISAFSEVNDELDGCDAAIVCVGTPSAPDGAHDMRFVAEVSRQIALHVGRDRTKPLTVVYRSTIRPGSMDGLIQPIFAATLGDSDRSVELVYSPEFLRESSAVADYFAPPKVVIGTQDGTTNATTDELHVGIDAPRFITRFAEAEITKFVDNTWHAVKVAFANEIGRISLQLGVDPGKVHEVFVSDTKLNISPSYLRPGGAFGGSCLPKDVRALQNIVADCGINAPLIDSLMRSNDAHKYRLFQLVTKGLRPGASVLLAGLAFKAGTDDLRESPNVDLARSLLRERYKLSIFDPAVDAGKLVGANLGYAWSYLPQFASLLVTKQEAESRPYDRVIFANRTARLLSLPSTQDVVDIGTLGNAYDSQPASPDVTHIKPDALIGEGLSRVVQRAVA